MPAIINTNMASLNAQRNLNTSQSALQVSLQRLSSGLRINSAKDDAAGMAISDRMTSQIRGNQQASRNANDGISLSQTAEGALSEVSNNLQRIRELAIQSANATNSSSDRATLQAEVSQLLSEIDRVAQNTSFNGVKLLDGSFTAQTFQVGANGTANDSIQISSVANARTTQLGGVGATTAATRTSTATTAALSAGDLTLNGHQVGASVAGAAPGQGTASAYSIANAINGVSANSGVTATANATTVTGSAATVFTAIAANSFQINGINVGAVAAGGTAAGQGANLAAAINAVATQTGVSASANATSGAVTLTATDGRDISVNVNPTNVAQATFLTQTGLATGNVGVIGTSAALGAFTTLSSATATDKVSITVDGISLLASTAVGAGGVLAATIATNVNTFLTSNTGYKALLTSSGADLGTAVAGANVTAGITLVKTDGTAVALSTVFTDTTGAAAPAGAVAGGFASAAATSYPTTTAVSFAAGTGSVANHGTVTLNSTSASGIVVGGASVVKAGLTTGTTAATTVSSVSAISAVDISTASGATSALAAIDGALTTVNSARANLGAIQNRFSSVVSSLGTAVENLTASRSRIVDTDFAVETSQLTRGQILQQAGTAMLAQANQLPNTVLTLLK